MKIMFQRAPQRGRESHIQCVVTTDKGLTVVFERWIGEDGSGDILIDQLNADATISLERST